jgi:hypothetical protein
MIFREAIGAIFVQNSRPQASRAEDGCPARYIGKIKAVALTVQNGRNIPHMLIEQFALTPAQLMHDHIFGRQKPGGFTCDEQYALLAAAEGFDIKHIIPYNKNIGFPEPIIERKRTTLPNRSRNFIG